jgi:hypothetical protein
MSDPAAAGLREKQRASVGNERVSMERARALLPSPTFQLFSPYLFLL